MSIHQTLLFGGWKPIAAGGAFFDGTNDYMSKGADFSGNSDSKSGILSFWIRPSTAQVLSTGTILFAATSVGGGTLRFDATEVGSVFGINARNAAGTIILNIQTNTAALQANTWTHVLTSWDLAAAASHIYLNDVSNQVVTTRTNDTIDYTVADWSIGAVPDGTQKFNGDVAELYFAPGQFLDFSTEANRRKFITKTLVPANLGTDGSLPTGTAPIAYQSIVVGGAPSGFATNKGTGGNFSITGTLTSATTSPSK